MQSVDAFRPGAASHFDAIVVGAGLGGLSTALHLQRSGLRVALIEQSQRAGGLCGTHQHQGREYVIACNDFGSAMPRWLGELGLPVKFTRHATHIHASGRRFSLPPDLRSITQLLRFLPDVLRYVRGCKAARQDGYRHHATLGALVDDRIRNPVIADLLKLPAYLMGVSPERLRLDALDDEARFGYGYLQPTTPDGGPQAMVDEMVSAITAHGELMLQTRYLGHESTPDGGKKVATSRGDLTCRFLVLAIPEQAAYPTGFPQGLPLGMYLLAVDERFAYPAGVHTCVHYPPNVSQWFGALERGEQPREFGFHVFKSDLAPSGGCYTMNLFFYPPKDDDLSDPAARKGMEHYIFRQLEAMLPGITQAVREQHYLSPRQFVAKHGLSSRVLPVVTPAGFDKPANYDPAADVYRAGAAYYPPGDHGSAAVLSGRLVAERIAAQYAAEPTTAFSGTPQLLGACS
ncbi:FAD-dependent oxidoreductase [Chitiniphilus purpureus]|uniref:FAD-dependent oxidoreductase n=1 Tax=Chitiniphilus purpureus TaxID=2981137 RepID=A0ABY6DVQ2_9NEIS|nr:FAD-dependent oxidoreductase [Chitiniphilus sp. CD1]UXY17136.1 FAD-dependent oxidoreductase [Chitiniphilus sp. CD1]